MDAVAVEAMLSVLEGTGKTFIGTSELLLGAGHVPIKKADTPLVPNFRTVVKKTSLAPAGSGIKTISVRLAPSVHCTGDHGFVPSLINFAQKRVHPPSSTRDPTSGRQYTLKMSLACMFSHSTRPPPVQPCTERPKTFLWADRACVGEGLGGLPTKAFSKEEAGSHFGPIAMFCGLDNPTSAELTREPVGWSPREKGLVEDSKDGTYF